MAKIPTRLEDLIPVGAYEKVVDLLQRPDLSGRLREALGKVGLKELNPLEQVQDAWQQAKTWLGSLADLEKPASQLRINATGCLFSVQWDRVPMIPTVGFSWARNSSAFLDRQQCLQRSSEVMDRSLGVKQCAWLSDPLSAFQCLSRAIGKTVVIARCDCVRVAGLGDVRAMLAAFGNSLQEIGAINGASEQDWAAALAGTAGAIVLLASPSGLPRDQWAEHRAKAIAAARLHGAKVVELLVDGCFSRDLCTAIGFPHPVDRLEQGANIVMVPTHCLVGGARGLVCLGETDGVQAIINLAGSTGCELDCAGISANLLAVQLATLAGEVDCGLISALSANPDNLRNRSQRLAIQLQGLGPIQSAEVVESKHSLGPSPWDQYHLSNSVIAMQTNQEPKAICDQLRNGVLTDGTAIETRWTDSRLTIDLRFVPVDDDHRIVLALKSIA